MRHQSNSLEQPAPVSHYELRPYQKDAVEATLAHFRKDRQPAVIVLPTGAGKSLVIAELAKIARGRVLVLAHVKELVEQNCAKYQSYGLSAGIYSAGLGSKSIHDKVIFGGIQSVARADDEFFGAFSLLVIDECHRVSVERDTQYAQVIDKLRHSNPNLCILGLTATPYRLDTGWIYRYHHRGALRTEEPRFFGHCIFDLSLQEMIAQKFLTQPVQIDAPVASYDFSDLKLDHGANNYRQADIEAVLKDQRRITPVIIQNIVDLSKNRHGVMIFTSSVRHAEEVLSCLPKDDSALIIGDTPSEERDQLIEIFKQRKIKYLVNVSVLTTGFDAPHVDVIAILRPTESVSLYQQIVGRGLRLSDGKTDCLVLDYTGVPHDIFSPVIRDDKPLEEAEPVKISCPMCDHLNDFWGLKDDSGNIVEHFGKKCCGAIQDPKSFEIIPCGFRYRYRNCEECGAENDLSAKNCTQCRQALVDRDTRLREAMASKEAHVMRPDSMVFEKKVDKKGNERLEVRYYDLDAQYLSEVFFLNSESDAKVFYYNFTRMHLRLPGRKLKISNVEQAIQCKDLFRLPMFIIARKQQRFWKIREKIF